MSDMTAVICEFNPIHPGHRHLLRLAAAGGDTVLCVMSGNFTQRGIPSVCDKYVRARAALLCGADLVVELPYPWCASGAEDFARGGAAVAAGMGADSLTFGSESGDLSLLTAAADFRDSPEFAAAMRDAERGNRSGGTAFLFDALLRERGIALEGGNDRLGAEYVRAGRRAGIRDFRPVRRMAGAPSAEGIREVLRREGPDAAWELAAEEAREAYRGAVLCDGRRWGETLFAHARLYLGDGGENDLLRYAAKTARQASDAEEFLRNLPTKKYTAARMRRELLFSLLGAGDPSREPRYTVLLAAGERGREQLAGTRRERTIPILVKPSDTASLDEEAKAQNALSRRADSLWAYLTGQEADTFLRRGPWTARSL